MKNLIIVRHGNYSRKNWSLTPFGEEQIATLAEFIKNNLEGKFWIGSSPVPRALQSARIIEKILESKTQVLYELNCEYDNLFPGQERDIHHAVRKLWDVDNIILSSHYAIKDYAEYFTEGEWGITYEINNLSKGKGICINHQKKTITIIP